MLKIRARKINENEIQSSVNTMYFIIGGIVALFLFVVNAAPDNAKNGIGHAILLIAIFTFAYFSWKPLGKAGELKQSVKEFVDAMKNFKVKSNQIIIENMIPQDKHLS